jgi:Rps23 Pro-64 3,4-dihydroxylase Tpa1-like proline 4-hydroxylase
MINFDNYNIEELRSKFLNAKPFNFIVIDNFLDTSIIKEIEKEVRSLPKDNWYDKKTNFQHINNQQDCATQSKKIGLNIRDQIPDKTNQAIDLFSSPKMLKFIEDITDIKDLQEDPSLLGGGVHKTETDGHLSIHCDFNIHPSTQKHRRINALLYLNSEWQPHYQGELELWNTDMNTCAHKIPPIANRLVIFRITDTSLHGSPNKWSAPSYYPRLSLAFYYYTDDRPEEEKADFHWAVWFKRWNKFY